MKKRVMAVVGLVVVVAGCVATQGTRIDADQTTDFTKGRTTKAEVVSKLGAPYSESSAQSGSVLLYVFSKQTAQASNFFPVLNWFKGRTDSENQTCRFAFDTKGMYQGHDCTGASASQRAALEANRLTPAH